MNLGNTPLPSDPAPPTPTAVAEPGRGNGCLLLLLGFAAGVVATLGLATLAFLTGGNNSSPTWSYSVPSPGGSASVSFRGKGGVYEVYLRTNAQPGQAGSPAEVGLVSNLARRGLFPEEGIVAGWSGDAEVTIGTPYDVPLRFGPREANGVTILYDAYDPDIQVPPPARLSRATLRAVRYEAETTLLPDGVRCAIHIKAADGQLFGDVSLSIIGDGMHQDRVEARNRSSSGGPGLGEVSLALSFAVDRLPGGASPPLNPVRAQLGDLPTTRGGAAGRIGGPLQDGMSLRYTGYNSLHALALFGFLRDGGYVVRFDLSFGKHQVEYLIPDPIPPAVAAEYQRCEARTHIFKSLIGPALSR